MLTKPTFDAPSPPRASTQLRQEVNVRPMSKRLRQATHSRPSFSHLLRRHVRYLSVLPCGANGVAGDDRVCLYFKNDVFEQWVAGMSSDDGLNFRENPALVMPRKSRVAFVRHGNKGMTSNLAMLAHNRSFIVVGGLHRRRVDPQQNASQPWLRVETNMLSSRDARRGLPSQLASSRLSPADDPDHTDHKDFSRTGIWAATGNKWTFTDVSDGNPNQRDEIQADGVAEPVRTQWRDKRLLLSGSHPGCVERRQAPYLYPGVCEFDGRLSLVYFRDRYFLYARANMAARGERFVQVTSSVDLKKWSPFELVKVEGYNHTEGDIYFFAVQLNPVHPRTLVALFPLVHHLQGCIGISLSADGVHWAAVQPLLGVRYCGQSCRVAPGRAGHDPSRQRRMDICARERSLDITRPLCANRHLLGVQEPRGACAHQPIHGVVRIALAVDEALLWQLARKHTEHIAGRGAGALGARARVQRRHLQLFISPRPLSKASQGVHSAEAWNSCYTAAIQPDRPYITPQSTLSANIDTCSRCREGTPPTCHHTWLDTLAATIIQVTAV